MTDREREGVCANIGYDLGWLDGFSAVLWALVRGRPSDEMVSEYEAHVKRLRKSVGMEGVEEWKS